MGYSGSKVGSCSSTPPELASLRHYKHEEIKCGFMTACQINQHQNTLAAERSHRIISYLALEGIRGVR